MLSSAIPPKFDIPFASSAGGSYIRAIPKASQIGITAGAASLTDGFPPLCFTPRGSGGVPPAGLDFNGILKQITQWSQWQAAGGPVLWDSAYSTAIGGYPKGAIVGGASNDGTMYLSTTENNTTNPNIGGAGWTPWEGPSTYVNSTTAGSLLVPGTPFILKWKAFTTSQPGTASDIFTGGYGTSDTFTWNSSFPNTCIAAWAAYGLAPNMNCTFGLISQNTGGGLLYTQSGQNLHGIPVVCFGFGL